MVSCLNELKIAINFLNTYLFGQCEVWVGNIYGLLDANFWQIHDYQINMNISLFMGPLRRILRSFIYFKN